MWVVGKGLHARQRIGVGEEVGKGCSRWGLLRPRQPRIFPLVCFHEGYNMISCIGKLTPLRAQWNATTLLTLARVSLRFPVVVLSQGRPTRTAGSASLSSL